MADQFEDVEVIGWANRIVNSFVGVVLGIVLFFGSFFLLYWNEGRVNLSPVARTAVEVSATTLDRSAQGKLVSTTGVLTSPQLLDDNLFLKPGKYIAIARDVDMFAWVEHKETKTQKNNGGSETKITTYTYRKEWTADPEDSSSFKHPQSHENPAGSKSGGFHYIYSSANKRDGSYRLVEKSIADARHRVSDAQVGVYRLSVDKLDLPELTALTLNSQNTKLDQNITLAGNYLYNGKQTISNPQVGDLRIHYTALPQGTTATVFGKLDGDRMTPYFAERNTKLYQIFSGNRDEAIAKLATDYEMLLWVLRLVGFLMMWWGLFHAFAPISVFLDFIPMLGTISESVTGAGTFLIAFVLSAITILVSMLLHHPVALGIAIAIAVGLMLVLRRKRFA